MRRLYTLVLYLATPLVLLRLYWRGRQAPGYRRRWGERFGFIAPPPAAGCLWIHAVSVGEVRAALPLIRRLQGRYPDAPLLVTTTTPTGSRQVREALPGVHHAYAPYDLPGAVARFFRRARPRLAVIMETELWPNLFHHCRAAGVPLVVANARLSERSMQGYARLAGLTARTLARVTVVAAQSGADGERFRRLGAPRVRVIGNIKYDLTPPPGLAEQGQALRRGFGGRPVLIAASTHQGEDEQVLEAFAALRRDLPEALLLLVPRHPERFAAVTALCRRQGLAVVTRSSGQSAVSDVFMGDTMGELLLFYAAADVAFVGGSLVPTGGHNVLEPALLGLPVLFGPHMFNFAEIARHLLEAEAAWQVRDAADLAAAAGRLLANRALRESMGRHGQAVVESNRGALAALLEIIDGLLKKAG
ncbi:MAG: lipid IV(A) 3-deoxy-D-manno-octulosonic acid transferase [Pseudomonadota bacterium]|nr:lipid IV(A) 3-deoxy-D-manno-octulosonic acid transferase [Pseudomonadota bacterium]